MNRLARNRILYGLVLLVVLGLTWMYGGRMLYLSLYAFLLMPLLSYILTFILLRGLRVTQSAGQTTLVKEEPGRYTIAIRNRTPLMYDHIECLFMDDHFAVETEHSLQTISARPFKREVHEITFRVRYRGEYRMGLRALRVNDIMGLFTLGRRLKDTLSMTVLPRVSEMPYFPLAMNLLSQANSNFDMREEDYATVSDIRRYEPTDSIKRVHWKLTAKRNEWMVKNFQSNALNRITFITDTTRRAATYEEALTLEDRMIETVLAVTRYCLRRAMPVEFIVKNDVKKEGRGLSDFDAIYQLAARLTFDDMPDANNALVLLNKCLNETANYINVVIATAKLDNALYERIVSANHNGHFIALLYFTTLAPDPDSDNIFKSMADGGVSCYRITDDTQLFG